MSSKKTINDIIKMKSDSKCQVTIDERTVTKTLWHPPSTGQKFDSGKLEMGEFFSQFPKALEGLCTVAQYGKIKYSEGNGNVNFKEVPEALKRYKDAMVRHLMAYLNGEWLDSESLCPHLYHLLWNVCAIIEIDIKGTFFDIKQALDKNRIKRLSNNEQTIEKDFISGKEILVQ